LTVSKLEESASFFTSLLGWKEVRRKTEFPAIFVSDGAIMLTLWALKEDQPNEFNRKKNIGLHHLALEVESEKGLTELYEHLQKHEVKIEFAPELVGNGPSKHMMCYEPSGIRIEFIWPGN
ncbi:MAG: VOC family protein, partial [Chloroflexia bacterium]|nr:VOC family protein [Chloroflexia bacterium]